MKKLSLLLLFALFALMADCSVLQTTANAAEDGAVPGVYQNNELKFTLTYPEHWTARDTLLPDEILRIRNTKQYEFPILAVSVNEASNSANLMNPEVFVKGAEEVSWPGSKKYKITEKKSITLNDGTPAAIFTYKWVWTDGKSKLITAALVTQKDGKYISTTATSHPRGPKVKELHKLLGTFKFY